MSDGSDHDHDMGKVLQEIESVLLMIPGAERVLKNIGELRSLLVERRTPRIAVIGRRGSGKSALANAFLGKEVLDTGATQDTTQVSTWVELSHQGRKLMWLDTPGLRAGESPERRDEVRVALERTPPDVILVTCKATQVDSGIDEDLQEVLHILEYQKSAGKPPPPVIALVTKVDELSPLLEKSPPYRGTKKANIERAVDVFRNRVSSSAITFTAIIPIGTYMRFFKDGTLAVDWRWNLQKLTETILAHLPDSTHAEAVRAFEANRALAKKVARRVVMAATTLAFVIGSTPLPPFADVGLIVPLQTTMVTAIVYLSGRSQSAKTIGEWIASLGVMGAGTGARYAIGTLLRQLLKWTGPIPGALAATSTWALGQAAIRYFIEDSSLDEAKAVYEQAKSQGAPSETTAPPSGENSSHTNVSNVSAPPE